MPSRTKALPKTKATVSKRGIGSTDSGARVLKKKRHRDEEALDLAPSCSPISSEDEPLQEKENAAPNVKHTLKDKPRRLVRHRKAAETEEEDEEEDEEPLPKRRQHKAAVTHKNRRQMKKRKEEEEEVPISNEEEDDGAEVEVVVERHQHKGKDPKKAVKKRKVSKDACAPVAAVPSTPLATETKKARDLCLSVKRHLARPLAEDESGLATDKTQLVPQTPRVSKMSGKEVVAKSDYDELLHRFSELKALRTTKAEKMYTKLQATAEAREKATAKFIEALKDENRRLREERDTLRSGKNTKQESKKEDVSQHLVAQLQLYRQITLLDAKPHPGEGADAFLCVCQNPDDKRSLKFILTITEDAVEYKPVEIGKQPRWEINEMFVKEIYFSPQFTPIFLSKLLATVYGKKVTP